MFQVINPANKKTGDLLNKDLTAQNGEKINALIQYDHQTNEFIYQNTAKVETPIAINNHVLTERQKNDWAKGKQLEIGPEKTPVRIDLNNTVGFTGNIKSISFEEGKTIDLNLSQQEIAMGVSAKDIENDMNFERQYNLNPIPSNDRPSLKWVMVEPDPVGESKEIEFVKINRDLLSENQNVISVNDRDNIMSLNNNVEKSYAIKPLQAQETTSLNLNDKYKIIAEEKEFEKKNKLPEIDKSKYDEKWVVVEKDPNNLEAPNEFLKVNREMVGEGEFTISIKDAEILKDENLHFGKHIHNHDVGIELTQDNEIDRSI